MSGQRNRVLAALVGATDNLIINISKIGNVAHFVAAIDEVAANHVKNNGGHRMANVGVGIDGGATDIHPHLTGLDRLKFFLLAGQRVVELERHADRSDLVMSASNE